MASEGGNPSGNGLEPGNKVRAFPYLRSQPQSVHQLYPSPPVKMGSLCCSDPHSRKHGCPLKAGFTEPFPVSRALSLFLLQVQVRRVEMWLSWGHVPAPHLTREGWDVGGVLYKAVAACRLCHPPEMTLGS